MWVAGKTVRSHCYARAISERFRNKELTYKVLYKFICLLYFTLHPKPILTRRETTILTEKSSEVRQLGKDAALRLKLTGVTSRHTSTSRTPMMGKINDLRTYLSTQGRIQELQLGGIPSFPSPPSLPLPSPPFSFPSPPFPPLFRPSPPLP